MCLCHSYCTEKALNAVQGAARPAVEPGVLWRVGCAKVAVADHQGVELLDTLSVCCGVCHCDKPGKELLAESTLHGIPGSLRSRGSVSAALDGACGYDFVLIADRCVDRMRLSVALQVLGHVCVAD